MKEIKRQAQLIGLKPGKLNKKLLVQSIQRKEGNFDCFSTAASGYCDQTSCLWRADCLSLPKKKAH